MSADKSSPGGQADAGSAALADAAALMRGARRAGLATLDRGSGHPYVSLVTVALSPAGQPVMLLSRLARHTRNLAADPRASLLFEPAGLAQGDPLALARVTVLGRAAIVPADEVRTAFLARHPEAAMYAGFADFSFYALHMDTAHFIGGFGRIIELSGSSLQATVRSAA